ncbi:zinc finger protein 784-like isoform X2 [Amblyomma americanum]
MVQCPYCPFVTRFASAIRRHLVRHTKERPHKCHLCPQNFQRRYQLTRHLVHQHGAKPSQFP